MAEVLRGDLSGVSLASLLQLVELECFCGELSLSSGELGFHNGDLVQARFLGLSGLDAAIEALVRARGPFALVQEGATSGEILGQTASLVIESCRLQDELERMGPASVEVVDAGRLSGELTQLVAALAHSGSVAAGIAKSGTHVVHVVDPLIEAVEVGAVRWGDANRPDDLRLLLVGAGEVLPVPAPTTSIAEPLPEEEPMPVAGASREGTVSFDDLVFDARRHVRNRAWDEAESALRQALEIRPGSKIVAQNLNRVRSLRTTD
ncbi:MAG: DUF4388 domain-containing protein [Myxococcota bacterium]